MSDYDTSTNTSLSSNSPLLLGAVLMVQVMTSSASVRTDMVSIGSTDASMAPIDVDGDVRQLHATIRRGANILASSVDEESEARLDAFLASTSAPPKKIKIAIR